MLLLLLCAYIVVAAATGVAFGIRPSLSVVGIAVSACAVLAMPALAVAKARVNRVLDSASLRADIAETAGCAYLAATTLVGLGVAAWLNLWWVQYVAGLALLVWLIPEVREAFEAGQEGHGTAAPGRA